ncbi:MAG: stage III sporulation protein AF [Clostridia bacterium]|nr:stage III sporulation protein AF [Clostridia bacterium]
MILKIRQWCEELIIAIVLCIIIESLIPNGNNKKYAKVIIGIYIIFVTLNPILEILNYDFEFNQIFEQEFEEVNSNLNYDMKDIYILGIEGSIKQDIEGLGYQVEEVGILLDINYENIEKIEIEILQDKNNQTNLKNENFDKNYQDIFEILKQNYLVNEDKILLSFK